MSKSQIFRTNAILLTLIISFGCKIKNDTSLNVEIQVPRGYYDSLTYHLSKESFTAYSLLQLETEYFDSTGSVCFDVETDRIGWFFITLHTNIHDNKRKSKSRIFLLTRPGESYKIIYDSTHPLLFRISGDFEEAQSLYNQFNHSKICSHPRSNWWTNTDSLPRDLLAHLDDSIYNTLKPFHDLYNKQKIDDEYFKTIQTQIHYSHADAVLDHLEFRQWTALISNQGPVTHSA